MTPKEVVQAWFENADTKNLDKLAELTSDRHQFHNPMTPEAIGKDEHIGIIEMMTGALDGIHHIDVILSEGDWVAVQGHWTGKHVGEFQGVQATGNNIHFTFSDFFEVIDGKIITEHLEMNPMAIMEQINVVPV